MAWADRKDQDLKNGGRRLARLHRLPTSSGALPELWIQLNLDYPHNNGDTVSMRADGRMTARFQYMRYPPFDTNEGREELEVLTRLSNGA